MKQSLLEPQLLELPKSQSYKRMEDRPRLEDGGLVSPVEARSVHLVHLDLLVAGLVTGVTAVLPAPAKFFTNTPVLNI